MKSLTKPERLEILRMKDKEGRTPVHMMAMGLSTAALARVLQPLSDEEKLSTLHSDSEIHPNVTQLENSTMKKSLSFKRVYNQCDDNSDSSGRRVKPRYT